MGGGFLQQHGGVLGGIRGILGRHSVARDPFAQANSLVYYIVPVSTSQVQLLINQILVPRNREEGEEDNGERKNRHGRQRVVAKYLLIEEGVLRFQGLKKKTYTRRSPRVYIDTWFKSERSRSFSVRFSRPQGDLRA